MGMGLSVGGNWGAAALSREPVQIIAQSVNCHVAGLSARTAGRVVGVGWVVSGIGWFLSLI